MTKDMTIKEDETYIVNNKIYNITKSELIYEFEEAVKTNIMMMGRHMTVGERRQIYKSIKGNYFIKVYKGSRFYIKDISKEDVINKLKTRSEINILNKYFPDEIEKLKEV